MKDKIFDQVKKKLKNELFNVILLNIQGLTKSKVAKIEQVISKKGLLFPTQTQFKWCKVNMSKGKIKYESMRQLDDKMDGGLIKSICPWWPNP